MKWFTAVYWIEDGEEWTPNQRPDQHRVVEAADRDEAVTLAVEHYGQDYDSDYDSDYEDGYPVYLAVPIEGRPTRAKVRRTVEYEPV